MNKQGIENVMDIMRKDPKVRKKAVRHSFLLFFLYYFGPKLEYEPAPFHYEIIDLLEQDTPRFLDIMAFRDSAKSTIVTTAYALWAIMGRQKKRHVVIASQTQQQVRGHMANINNKIQENALLRKDLGPFQEDGDEKRWQSFTLSNYGARITGLSVDQKVRGSRHNEYRPDLIIADDVEDTGSSRDIEGRDKTYRWFTEEIVPAGSTRARIVIVGNYLNDDSLMMRIQREIGEGLDGIFKKYAIIDENGRSAWPSRFPDEAAIQDFKRGRPGEAAWEREYLLHEATSEECIIRREWIRYYDTLPNEKEFAFISAAIGVDPAYSQKEGSAMTAMVCGYLYQQITSGEQFLYILPNLVNEKLEPMQLMERIRFLSSTIGRNGVRADIFVEQVAAQVFISDTLAKEGFPAFGVEIHGMSKEERLGGIPALKIQSGHILFPRFGAERLIEQIVRFGAERYKDLGDALSILAMRAFEKKWKDSMGFFEAMKQQYGKLQEGKIATPPEQPKFVVHRDKIAGMVNNPAWGRMNDPWR